MKASVILSTFNMSRHLEMVLVALARQSFADFEIVLCNDGSTHETQAVIDQFQKDGQKPLVHLWQEHKGFRKCKILNEGIRRSQGEVLIFLDGDCVPHRDFVRDHVECQERGFYLAGRRIELGEKISRGLTVQDVQKGFFDGPTLALLKSCFEKDSEHFQRTWRVTNPWIRRLLKMDRVDDMKGCNFSLSKNDMIAINGFDESYEGYGREDTDVELRLKNLGLQIKSMKGRAIQYHVWHPRREFTPANDVLLDEVIRTKRVKSLKGLMG